MSEHSHSAAQGSLTPSLVPNTGGGGSGGLQRLSAARGSYWKRCFKAQSPGPYLPPGSSRHHAAARGSLA